MPAATIGVLLSNFWDKNDNWITAAVSIALAIALAGFVNGLFNRRGQAFATAMVRGALTPEADTRLRFVRRLVVAVIVLLGVAVAASQFTGLSRLATSLLASGAIAAAVLGFAARQTLANLVAGVMLAISQPIRVGDWVTFDDAYGVIEDIRLNYTFMRTPSGQRVVIPNEKLASGIVRNDTLGTSVVGLDVAVWLPLDADVQHALQVLRDETGSDVSVADVRPEGVKLSVEGDPVPAPDRHDRESELRARCLRRLREEGLLGTPVAEMPPLGPG
jgi:small-conductance mechanosensitive channel